MALHTSRLGLREFRESDAAALARCEANPEIVRYAPHSVRTLVDGLDHIRALLEDAGASQRKIFDFAVVQRECTRLIGRCGLKLSDAEPTEATLWYVLARSAWGQGFATEAAQAVLAFGFEELRLHRVFVDIDPRNQSSLRVAEKLGLRREGHFRETTWENGQWRDSVVYALLDREYRARSLKVPMRASQRG